MTTAHVVDGFGNPEKETEAVKMRRPSLVGEEALDQAITNTKRRLQEEIVNLAAANRPPLPQ